MEKQKQKPNQQRPGGARRAKLLSTLEGRRLYRQQRNLVREIFAPLLKG